MKGFYNNIFLAFIIFLLTSLEAMAVCPDYQSINDWQQDIQMRPQVRNDAKQYYSYWHCAYNKMLSFSSDDASDITKNFEIKFQGQVTDADRIELLSGYLNYSSRLLRIQHTDPSSLAFYPVSVELNARHLARHMINVPGGSGKPPSVDELKTFFNMLEDLGDIYEVRYSFQDLPLNKGEGKEIKEIYDDVNWACIFRTNLVAGVDISKMSEGKILKENIQNSYDSIVELAGSTEDDAKCS